MADDSLVVPVLSQLKTELKIMCVLPDDTGRRCRYNEKRRVLPLGVENSGLSPEEMDELKKRRLQEFLGHFFTNHLVHVHPNEAEILRDKIRIATEYVVLKQLATWIATESL